MKLEPYLISCIKINSKWIKDLNIRAKTIERIEKTGEKLHYVGFSNDFLDMTPKIQARRKKQINWTSSKFKTPVHQRIKLSDKVSHEMGENIHKSHI